MRIDPVLDIHSVNASCTWTNNQIKYDDIIIYVIMILLSTWVLLID